jgi:hypothetical protein
MEKLTYNPVLVVDCTTTRVVFKNLNFTTTLDPMGTLIYVGLRKGTYCTYLSTQKYFLSEGIVPK